MIGKLYDWWCNCFSRPPRAASDTVDHCDVTAGGYGENPLQGLGCTEPPEIDLSALFPVIDPPQCFGVNDGPCSPMPVLYRVAFPCHVPGSTCQPEPYMGIQAGCCYGITHLYFPGAISTVEGCEFDETDTEVTVITLLPSAASPCVSTATVTLESGRTVTFTLTTTIGNYSLDVSIGPCDPPLTRQYSSGNFANCGGTFEPDGDGDAEGTIWPNEIIVVSGAGDDYDGPPIDLTPCLEGKDMGMFAIPTGPAPLFPPFQDCPTCWTADVSGVADSFGGVSETCCNNLNGSHTFCFSPKESQGDNLIFGTPCLQSSGHGNPDDELCSRYEWYTESPIVVTGFPCASTYSGDFIFSFFRYHPTLGCGFAAHNSGDILNSFTGSCVSNFDAVSGIFGSSRYYGAGSDSVWAFYDEDIISTVPKFTNDGNPLSPGDPHPAFYGPPVFSTTIDLHDTITFNRITDDINYPDSTLIGTWPDTIVLRRRGAGFCGPAPYDAQRRLWQLGYNKTAMKWRLESLASIQSPRYELFDENPCVGETKILEEVVSFGVTSGCETAPATITITRGTDDQCMACNSYLEPGCQVQLVRQCSSDNYALRHTSVVSANPKLSHICQQDRGKAIKQCCDVGCNYTPDTSGSPPCCSVQKVPYTAHNDPWFDTLTASVDIWRLDFSADPVQLIGSFFEGDIVYEVDINGVQCGKTPTQLYRSDELTTLPDDLKQLYPTNVCMVGDTLKTCNVRADLPEYGEVDENYAGGPCDNAGYDPETGHEDFCACNDSCAPVIAGAIVTGKHGECVSIVCAARIAVSQRDPDAKSKYSYIACASILNQSSNRYDVLVQVIYCVGPDDRWAADWYCSKGGDDDFGPYTFRVCGPCSLYIGDYLGTTYSHRGQCDTLPNFGPPGVNAGGFGGVGYGKDGGCICGTVGPCCDGVVSLGGTVPDTLYATVSGSASAVVTLTYGTVIPVSTSYTGWAGAVTICGHSVTIYFWCQDNQWTMFLAFPDFCVAIPSYGTATVTCDPFEVVMPSRVASDSCGSCGSPITIDVTVTA